MHNVKRFTGPQRAARRAKSESMARELKAVCQAALARKAEKRYDDDSLGLAAKAVLANPDFGTVWNFRREALQHTHPDAVAGAADGAADDAATSAARRAACETELALTQECLGLNPKSYPVWFHRQWVVEWGRCSWQWPVELKLTTKLLALDDRNFHCWTYRRFVVQTASVADAAELSFTSTKIDANFSNYSAWHQRSKLLPAIAAAGGAALGPTLRDELQLVRNAFFTAPEDSSAWFYHRWLLAQLGPGGAAPAPAADYEATLRAEQEMVGELLELEPECKWVLAASVHLGGLLGEPVDEPLATLRRVDALRATYYDHSAAASASVSALSLGG